tara:strand:+ start:1648 stop:4623 length:2976 start_codon:yes stop_codon:yes gene_type:complete
MSTISDYKKLHPEYANIPDLDLAESLYEKVYKNKGIDKSTFFKKAFPQISEKRVTDEIIFPDDEFGSNFEFESTELPFMPTIKEIAESAGVSVNDPATSKARFAASLGYDQNQKAIAIKKVLSDQFKTDIDVRVGPNTGELEYFNPKTQEYALVDAPGFDMGDFADLGGDAMVIIPDIAGTIAGTMFSGPVGGIGLGAIAALGGEYARLKLGQKLYGINKDLSDTELLQEAAKVGLISGAAGFIGIGGAKLIKGMNNIIKGRVVPSDALETLTASKVKEADEIALSINRKLKDAKSKSTLKFTLAEAADDADLLATQASFENVRRLGYLEDFRKFNREQANALDNYFKILKNQFGTSNKTNYDSGVLIKKVIEKRQDPIIQNIIKKQENAEELLTKSIFRLPDGSSKTTGVEFRSIINDLGETYKKSVDMAAKELDKASGTKLINADKIAKALNELTDKEMKSLVTAGRIEGVLKPGVYKDLLSKDSKILLSDARETVSVLGKLIRDKFQGKAAGETVDTGKLLKLQGAFLEQMNKDAGSAYMNQLQNFNSLVKTNKELLNNDIISKLTKIEIGNKLKIADEDIFRTTFKRGIGSGKTAKEVFDVIKNSPDAMAAYKNSIFDFYKKEVINEVTGKPNLVKHRAFMKDYEAPLKTFFTDAEYKQISKIGGLQKNVEDLAKSLQKTQKQLQSSFEGKLLNSSPQEIFNKIYKPNNIGEITELKNILSKNKSVFKSFQRDVLTDLNERVTVTNNSIGQKVLNPKAFDEYLNGAGGERGRREALKIIFGDEYVKNLDTLNKALQIASRKSPSRAAEGVVGNFFTDIIRARLGQFTTRGRVFTAARRLFAVASNRVIKEALLNPQSLEELIRLKTLSKSSKLAASILAKLGGSIFYLPEEGEIEPTKSSSTDENLDVSDVETEPNNVEQLRGLFNRGEPRIDLSMIPQSPKVEPINTPNINPNLFAARQPTGIMQNLSPTEQALLSPSEQIIASRT